MVCLSAYIVGVGWWVGQGSQGTQAKPVQSVMMLCSIYVGPVSSVVQHCTTTLYSCSTITSHHQHNIPRAAEKTALIKYK